jgi:peptide/nickel transport system permease protein
MSNFRILLSIVSAIVLFLYGLGAFSQEIQTVGGERLKNWLGRLTQSRWRAVLLGAVATAVVQSSSAITALTVAFVDAGTMSFQSTLGVLLGIISAVRQNSVVDVATMLGANVGVSMPVFWLGLMLAYVFALTLKGTLFWIPPSGRLSSGMTLPPLSDSLHLGALTGLAWAVVTFASNSVLFNALITGHLPVLRDALWHLILPCVAVGTIPLSIIARMTRSSMLEVLGQDYVRTARAKGLRERVVVLKHALRNALLPIVTVVGLSFGGLMSGAVLTETVFSLPGVGTQLVSAILSRDYPVVQSFTVVIAVIFVTVNFIVDISYAYLDPRIRL